MNLSSYGNELPCNVRGIINNISQDETMDFASALEIEGLSVEEMLETKDTICVVKLYQRYIKNNGQKGYYHLVFSDLWKALLLADEAKLNEEKFNINLELGTFYGFMQKFDKAEEHFQEANNYKRFVEENNQYIFSYYHKVLGYYFNKGNMDKAKLYLDSCHQIRKLHNVGSNNFLEINRANIYREEGKFDKALTTYYNVLDTFKVKYPNYLGVLYSEIGETYSMLGQNSKSLSFYLRAESNILKQKRHIDRLPNIYRKLSKIFEKERNYKEALNMSEKEYQINLTLFDSRYGVNSQIFKIQDEFETYKEKEELRIKEYKLSDLQKDQKLLLFQRLILAISFIFLSIIGLIYFKLQRQKINAEKDLNHELQIRNMEKQELLDQIETKNEELITYSNIMSHDLKAPLRSISSFSALIKKQLSSGFNKDKITEFNNYIINSADSMTSLIEDLLMYSRIEVEKLNFTKVDLDTLVNEVLTSFAYDINLGQAAINFETLPVIKGNKELLKTVFHNLISNGLKYQPKNIKGHRAIINIWAIKDNNDCHVFIEDNGIGVKENFVNKLFDSFTRNHNSSEYSGTGLGLSICKKIMHKHKGQILLEKTSDSGSIFKLTFPITEINA